MTATQESAAVDRAGPTPVTVLVADDHPLMRAALAACIEAEPDFSLVGQARDGLEAVDLAERFRPDVTVMDIRMPGLDGVAATKRLVGDRTGPAHRVLAITTFDLDEYVFEALRAGPAAFCSRTRRRKSWSTRSAWSRRETRSSPPR